MICQRINNEPQHFGNDWGLFVDIENPSATFINNHKIFNNFNKYKTKSTNNKIILNNINNINNINKDIDDEYNYYITINKNSELNVLVNNNINFSLTEENNRKINKSRIVKFGSATVITVLLTYFIFFIL